jgi:hypothetical protein
MSLRMPDGNRAQWMALLEVVSSHSPNQIDAEWEWLMRELGLPLGHFLAVREAIQQGRWRKAKNPRSYVKTVANREARKMGLVSDEHDPSLHVVAPNSDGTRPTLGLEETWEHINYVAMGDGPVKGADGTWRQGGGGENDYDRPEWAENFDSAWDYLLSKLPDDLRVKKEPRAHVRALVEQLNASTDEIHLRMRSPVTPNWTAWAERAGFDEWEQLALECRVSRKSREKALAEQPDEASRKALQAAWKRVDRTGTKRLGEALKINSARNVPDDPFSDT